MGNRFEVSAAVFTDGVYVEKIFSMELTLGFFGHEKVYELAQAFVSIQECAKELQRFYDELLSREPSISDIAFIFPSPTPPDNTPPPHIPPSLAYKSRINRSGKPIAKPENGHVRSCALYLATLKEPLLGDPAGTEVVVKFATQYNPEAHQTLADIGRAPKFYGIYHARGGLFMIVMGRVYGLPISQLSEAKMPKKLSRSVYEETKGAIEALHGRNLVFGDLRAQNIMTTDDSGEHIMFIDFDWAGKHGESTYIATINESLWVTGTVERGGIMLKDHDLAMLPRIEALCDGNNAISSV
jgi:hypothetical protein